jgi:hypothetical protein
MLSRAELAALLCDEDVSDAAITRAIVDPAAELARLAVEIATVPDASERADMERELRGMLALID